MGKPSMFSRNYHTQMKRRKLNKFLFILLIICIAFFSGKYYLKEQNIDPLKNAPRISFHPIKSVGNWWHDLTGKHKSTSVVSEVASKIKDKDPASSGTANQTTTSTGGVSTTPQETKPVQQETGSYVYNSEGQSYTVTYQKGDQGIQLTGLTDVNGTSEYSIYPDGSRLVFDIKSSSSIILCDNTGQFTDVTRPSYTTRSTHHLITKEAAMSYHKGYVWAEKPCFTLDGRIAYLSRLPYIRDDATVYLWTEDLKGGNYKSIYQIGSDASFAYAGYDGTGRLMMKIKGILYYLDKGSNWLKKN